MAMIPLEVEKTRKSQSIKIGIDLLIDINKNH